MSRLKVAHAEVCDTSRRNAMGPDLVQHAVWCCALLASGVVHGWGSQHITFHVLFVLVPYGMKIVMFWNKNKP